MYSFKNDYSEGAHPEVLKLLQETNMEQTEGYGLDPYSQQACHILKSLIQRENVDIHLIPGGTQTNLIAISAFLRPHEAVISAQSGHILVHETGAIEATGHKVIPVETADGKLRPEEILQVVRFHTDEHMVKPGWCISPIPPRLVRFIQRTSWNSWPPAAENSLLFIWTAQGWVRHYARKEMM